MGVPQRMTPERRWRPSSAEWSVFKRVAHRGGECPRSPPPDKSGEGRCCWRRRLEVILARGPFPKPRKNSPRIDVWCNCETRMQGFPASPASAPLTMTPDARDPCVAPALLLAFSRARRPHRRCRLEMSEQARRCSSRRSDCILSASLQRCVTHCTVPPQRTRRALRYKP